MTRTVHGITRQDLLGLELEQICPWQALARSVGRKKLTDLLIAELRQIYM